MRFYEAVDLDSGEHREIELKPGGCEMPVTFDTRQEYVAWWMWVKLGINFGGFFWRLSWHFEGMMEHEAY